MMYEEKIGRHRAYKMWVGYGIREGETWKLEFSSNDDITVREYVNKKMEDAIAKAHEENRGLNEVWKYVDYGTDVIIEREDW